jgi:hypothetical protein
VSESFIRELKLSFSDILKPNGGIYRSGPLPAEIDEPDICQMPRLIVDFNRIDFGRLKVFIDVINRNQSVISHHRKNFSCSGDSSAYKAFKIQK